MIQKILLATSNSGKIKEFQYAFRDLPIHLLSQSDLNIPDIEETGLSFIENALIKARHAAKFCDLPVLSDDSGLVVDALDGAPGIYSARYADKQATADANIAKLLAKLSQKKLSSFHRSAQFYCVLAYLNSAHDPLPIITEATWEGLIAENIGSQKGFGYEPVFYLPEFDTTSAELPLEKKLNISHRGKAIKQLLARLNWT